MNPRTHVLGTLACCDEFAQNPATLLILFRSRIALSHRSIDLIELAQQTLHRIGHSGLASRCYQIATNRHRWEKETRIPDTVAIDHARRIDQPPSTSYKDDRPYHQLLIAPLALYDRNYVFIRRQVLGRTIGALWDDAWLICRKLSPTRLSIDPTLTL